MKYIIRANPLQAEPPTYWLPQNKGSYVRTADINQAFARGFATRADARAYMDGHGVAESPINEIIEVQ